MPGVAMLEDALEDAPEVENVEERVSKIVGVSVALPKIRPEM